MTKAVFLDRDGVINRKLVGDDYVTRWEDFEILPGVVAGIRQLNRAGLSVIVVTNQRCVAKGLITTAELEGIHQRMLDFLAERGARIDAVYYCPHELAPVCSCRKPAPGMLLEAARDCGIDLSKSWMIGDSDIDIEAGKKAGCKTARLQAGYKSRGRANPTKTSSNCADIVSASFLDAVQQLLHDDKLTADSRAVVTRHLVGRIQQ